MRLHSILMASLASWILADAAWGTEPTMWQTRPIEFEAITETSLIQVGLDSPAYSVLQDSMVELRVIDDRQKQVAYVVRRRTGERTTERTWAVAGATMQPSADQGLVIQFELEPNDPIPNRLNIVTPLFDFEQSVTLFGTIDGQEQELVRDVVFDYRRYMDIRRTELKIPPTTARSFRLVIASPTAEAESALVNLTRQLRDGQEVGQQERLQINRRPFRIERLEFRGPETKPSHDAATLVPYPIKIESVTQDDDRKQTILALSSQRQPLSKLSFDTPDRNFDRLLQLRIPQDDKTFSEIASTHLRWFDLQTIQEQRLSVGFSRQRETRYQVVIENGDSPPLEISSVRAEGEVDDVYFLAAPGRTYSLAYGIPDLGPANYDTAAITASLQKGLRPLPGQLGDASFANFAPELPPKPRRELWNNPWVIGPTIVVLLIVFGSLLYRAASQIESAE